MRHPRAILLALTLSVLSLPAHRAAAAGPEIAHRPWLDSSLPPDRRADLALRAMTRSEKLSLESIRIDPRLLAVFDESHDRWQRAAATYRVRAGDSSASFPLSSEARLPAWSHEARCTMGGST